MICPLPMTGSNGLQDAMAGPEPTQISILSDNDGNRIPEIPDENRPLMFDEMPVADNLFLPFPDYATQSPEQTMPSHRAINTTLDGPSSFATGINLQECSEAFPGAAIHKDNEELAASTQYNPGATRDYQISSVERQSCGLEADCSCPLFPKASDDHHEIIAAEDFGHAAGISNEKYQVILNFWESQLCACCKSPFERKDFIDHATLNIMIQLYYEYHDPWMPFVHHSVFSDDAISWILVLAIASVGCQHTNLRNSELIFRGLHFLLQRALPQNARSLPCQRLHWS